MSYLMFNVIIMYKLLHVLGLLLYGAVSNEGGANVMFRKRYRLNKRIC